MNEEVYEKYLQAGEIAAKARDYGAKLIREGASIIEVVTEVEEKISENANLAFPVNISINEVAAHFTPRHDDSLCFKKGDLVKLDVGAHVDGYIADTAITIEVGRSRYSKLIEAADKALKNAIGVIKADVDILHIGKIVGETIKGYGFVPIDNLTGHSLERFILHAGLSIPNFYDKTMKNIKLVKDMVIAVEPFATNGAGHVIAGDNGNIYRYIGPRRFILHNPLIKREIKFIKDRFKTLPFAERWYHNLLSKRSDLDSRHMLNRLVAYGCIKQYNELIEKKRGMVAQSEHTVIVHEDDCEIITK
jgi:methionyl aminopeptidase